MSAPGKSQITIYIRPELALPDKGEWTNRFQIASESSDHFYVVAQHKTKRHWGCSCPGWRTKRVCKHLSAIGVPTHERPYEPLIEHGE